MSRIYETDSYIKELKTVVTEAGKDEKGRYYVCLEDTVFFPEEGGQNADTGVIIPFKNGEDPSKDGEHCIRVLEGLITGRNTCSSTAETSQISIKYIVSEPIEAGSSVLCRLDWDVRYDRMQNHSGEHILSGIIHRKYGFDNVGFHLSDTGFVTLDFNGVPDRTQVMEAEREANRVIYANMPIRDSYPSREELKDMEYRSKIDIDGQVRLITIGNEEETVDVCACCAPHVARTGEIGILKIMSVINWKGGVRISMLCGRRAFEYINNEHEILTETAKILSTEIVNVPELVRSRCAEAAELKTRLAAAIEANILGRIGAGEADFAGCVFVSEDITAVSMKNIYNVLSERYPGYVGIFAGDDNEGYRYNAGSREKDSRELAALLRERFGAKGGGSSDMIQGRITALRSEIEGFFHDNNDNL